MKQKLQVLLVDDDPFLRNLLSTELAVRGFLVVTAINGLQALNLVEAGQVRAVVTDIFMPDMDGIELIQSLRKRCPGIPIFAMSGNVRHAISEDFLGFARRLGADEIFAKPVDLALLITKLETYCKRDLQ
jgi:CheY-like chemotaxis protein